MGFPSKALFAFNANIDYLKVVNEEDLAKIEAYSSDLSSKISESFAWGVQKEIIVDVKACEFFLSSIKWEKTLIGGQAGNAAEQASSLGMECYLHSNFMNEKLLSLFSHKERIFAANEKGFAPATEFSSTVKNAHHFVLENAETGTRFIASYDPLPIHLEDNFCHNISKELPNISKAFLGGFHLIQTPLRLMKFVEEIKRWKEINPRLQIFVELGEFQNKEVMEKAKEELFPIVDMVGLNDTELAAFGVELEELGSHAKSLLYHTPDSHAVYPESELDEEALLFAKKCASYKAKFGKCASEKELDDFEAEFVETPAHTVGLGDTFSCAYFMKS